MTEKECYAVLEISSDSDMETVKKAYRRLAFALHPDLNPDLPNAGRRFQQINEAYVTLVHLYADKKSYKKHSSKKPWFKTQNPQAEQTGESAESFERVRREAEKAYTRAKGHQGSEGKAAPGKESHRRASHASFHEKDASSTSSSHGFSSDSSGDFSANFSGSSSDNSFDGVAGDSSDNPQGPNAKERVIGDILNDPFAKRVFEDIYKRIHDVTHEKIIRPAAETVLGSKERRKTSSQRGSLVGRLKGWALRQIDDEQVLHLPRERIVPGARVRMQIQHGIASEVQTIEVTLPLEFGPGKTMRLKGLGKRVGSLAGDLYIRIEPV